MRVALWLPNDDFPAIFATVPVPQLIVTVEAFPVVESPNGVKVQRVRLREMAEALLRQQVNKPADIPAELAQR